MKKFFTGIIVASIFLMASPADAATTHVQIDQVVVKSDVAPEIKNNRTMVPLRVISENLGAQVQWKDAQITLSTDEATVILNVKNKTVIKNGNVEQLDVQPYVKSNRTFVPLRFIAETFGSQVEYSQGSISITSTPLLLDNEQIKTLRYEYNMAKGGEMQFIKGHAYHQAIYKVLQEQKGEQVEAPKDYYWRFNLETVGSYTKLAQYDFLNQDNTSVEQYDIYELNQSFPAEELAPYPTFLLHDFNKNVWYVFTEKELKAIQQILDNATNNGFTTK
ncbi:copper amine oxidase N-terminal domain-containing protein [Lysinibacillus sp. NPDC098008]|uniref:copper amine oxidase N-terminal domain-containing protein n=1 Tax=Lysinibacillus sp. NPDC098008 TaxID=3364146 RepID=UPI003808A5AA